MQPLPENLELTKPKVLYWCSDKKSSGAERSGLQKGDIIVKLDGQKIATYADLSGYINTKRPMIKYRLPIPEWKK
jgi:type IV secretory pathway protease TraF